MKSSIPLYAACSLLLLVLTSHAAVLQHRDGGAHFESSQPIQGVQSGGTTGPVQVEQVSNGNNVQVEEVPANNVRVEEVPGGSTARVSPAAVGPLGAIFGGFTEEAAGPADQGPTPTTTSESSAQSAASQASLAAAAASFNAAHPPSVVK